MTNLDRPTQLSTARMAMLWSVILSLLLGGLASVWLKQGPTELTVDSAVEEFRKQDPVAAGPQIGSAAPPSAESTPDGAPVAPSAEVGPTDSGTSPGGSPPVGGAPAGSPGAPASSAFPPPKEGVYPQRTEGFEETDALGGSRHDYPPETPVIARRTDCGVRERWQPLRERWDESELCFVGEAVEIRVFRKHNEFFQRQQTLTYDCPAGSRVFDRSEPVGAQWTWQCRTSDGQIDTLTKVVGVEQRTVAGQQLELVRMRYDSTLTGSSRGTQTQERLIEPRTGRAYSIKSDVDVQTNSPFGEVGYQEHYLIDALTIEPRT